MMPFSAAEAGASRWRCPRTLLSVVCCLSLASCGPFVWEEKDLAPTEPLPTAAPLPQPVTPPPRFVMEGLFVPELEELRHLECRLATRFIQSLPPDRLRSSLVVSPHALTRAIAALAATTTGATRAELVNLLGSEQRLEDVLWWLELGEHRWRDLWELEDREARERRKHEDFFRNWPSNRRKPPFVRYDPLSVAAELFLFGDATYDEVLDKFPRSPAHFGSAFDRQKAENAWWQGAPEYAARAVTHIAGGHVLASTLSFIRPFGMWKENPSDRRPSYINKSNEHLQRAGFCYSEFFGPLIDDTRVHGVARFDYVAVTPVLAGPLETLQSACEIFRVGDETTLGELAALEPEFAVRSVTRLDDWLQLEGVRRIFDPETAEWPITSGVRPWLKTLLHPMSLEANCYGFNSPAKPPASLNSQIFRPKHVLTFDRPFALAVSAPAAGVVLALAWIVPDQDVEER